MGGGSTEISPLTTDIVVEAAHFDAITIARSSRRHRLSTEASRRFERGVDPALPEHATERHGAVAGGAGRRVGRRGVGLLAPVPTIQMPASHPGEVAGREISERRVVAVPTAVGCSIEGRDLLSVSPPSWRPTCAIRRTSSKRSSGWKGTTRLPRPFLAAPVGRGLYARAATGAGSPDGRSPAPDTPRLRATRSWVERFGTPWASTSPMLAGGRYAWSTPCRTRSRACTTCCPSCALLQRNVSRGFDLALFEAGLVYLPRNGSPATAPAVPVDRRPDPRPARRS